MDMFWFVSKLPGVANVKNFYPKHWQDMDLVFWICPNISSKGWRYDPKTSGLTASFVPGLSVRSNLRLIEALNIATRLSEIPQAVNRITALYATADSLLLMPIPGNVPSTIPTELSVNGLSVVPTHSVVTHEYLQRWGEFYHSMPWSSVPRKFVELETERLKGIPWGVVPKSVMQDWITRVFAGYAKDGVWLREFFKNPVIIGVESPGVVVMQNSALKKEDWVPVIQLS